jgi:hypothetical protein
MMTLKMGVTMTVTEEGTMTMTEEGTMTVVKMTVAMTTRVWKVVVEGNLRHMLIGKILETALVLLLQPLFLTL